MSLNKTPIISSQRKDCATFYTFGSAMEDIGLNINERNNKVSLSHYVLLNLPNIIDKSDFGETIDLNLNNIISDETQLTALTNKDVDTWLPTILQGYAMNMETCLRNQGTYDFSASKTVTERVFWKFLQKTGALKLKRYTADDGTYYYHEDFGESDTLTPAEKEEAIKNCVIKGFGMVTSSNQTSRTHTVSNNTYITIPSSYGQMKYAMVENSDNNYTLGRDTKYYSTNETSYIDCLEGHTSFVAGKTEPYFDEKTEDNDVFYNTKSEFSYNNDYYINDAVEMDFNISDLRKLYAKDETNPVSYDDLASKSKFRLASTYDFNAILVYYTITDSVGNSIATNLFGLMLLNSVDVSEVSSVTYRRIPSYTKKSSTGASFGNSYSVRLDIQTASIYDNTSSVIVDVSSAESSTLTDFNEVVSNLADAVKIMKNNAVAIANMNTVNQSVKNMVGDISMKVDELENSVNDLLHGNVREISAKSIDTEYADVDTLLSNIKVVGSDGVEYGHLLGSNLYHQNISADTIKAETINFTNIECNNGDFKVISETTGDALVTVYGNGRIESYYSNIDVPYVDIDENASNVIHSSEDSVLQTLFDNLRVTQSPMPDGTGKKRLAFYIDTTKDEVNNRIPFETNGNVKMVDTVSVLSLLLWKIKKLS